jgi:hypothetical protein
MSRYHEPIPDNFPIRPITKTDSPKIATCGYCGLSWDDSKFTAWTPSPAGRCPFELFHLYPDKPARTPAPPADVIEAIARITNYVVDSEHEDYHDADGGDGDDPNHVYSLALKVQRWLESAK